MIVLKLREAIEAYERLTGEKLTYAELARRTDLSPETIQSIGTRDSYNTTLRTIEKLCVALRCTPGELLALHVGDPLESESEP